MFAIHAPNGVSVVTANSYPLVEETPVRTSSASKAVIPWGERSGSSNIDVSKVADSIAPAIAPDVLPILAQWSFHTTLLNGSAVSQLKSISPFEFGHVDPIGVPCILKFVISRLLAYVDMNTALLARTLLDTMRSVVMS